MRRTTRHAGQTALVHGLRSRLLLVRRLASDTARRGELTFERLSPIQHVLRRPGMYIGGTTEQREHMWLYDLPSRRMVWREARYIPGLYKIFDEILVNALDNWQRDPSGTDKIDVTIDRTTGATTIFNSGRGIPVARHEVEDVWIPEMVLGSLFTGSNFDDSAKRTVGGRHGFGAKLTNLFSSSFEVQTADTLAGFLYSQRWEDNMSQRSDPTLAPLAVGAKDFTQISFTPDLSRFGVNRLHADMLGIFHRRVHEASATAVTACVSLNGERLNNGGLRDLARLYAGRPLRGKELAWADISDRWQVGACLTNTACFQAISFVNGVATPRGGTHVNHVVNSLMATLTPLLTRALKLPQEDGLTAGRVKPHLMIFINAIIDNPEFDSQSKEALTSPAKSFGGLCELPDNFVKSVAQLPGLTDALSAAQKRRGTKDLDARIGNSISVALDIPKLEDAELAGTSRAAECTLILTEGDSAKALAVAGLGVVGREKYGVFPLRGKPLNVRDVSLKKVGQNVELMNLMRALGLKPGDSYGGDIEAMRELTSIVEAESADARSMISRKSRRKRKGSSLRYGRLMLMADQDTDGSHIKGLVISMVHHFWPELLRANFVQEFQTPLLKAKRLSDGHVTAFFSLREYDEWRRSLSASELRRWRAKYYKGLGTSTAAEAREYFGKLAQHRIQLEWGGALDDDLIDMVFSKKRASDRREWMANFLSGEPAAPMKAAATMSPKLGNATASSNVTAMKVADLREALLRLGLSTTGKKAELRQRLQATIERKDIPLASSATEISSLRKAPQRPDRRSYESFVQDELVHYSLADLKRSLPSAIDGLKPSQRKVLYACFAKKLLPGAPEMKVAQLSGFCAEATAYHHGEASMHATIIAMAQNFVGANNVPLLEACGQFGTRAEGGRDAASARYVFTRLSPLTPLLFPVADSPILDCCVEDGQMVEPRHYVPVLPTLLLNGSSGIGTGWSTQCWSYHPLEILDNVIANAEGRAMQAMTPWFAGFAGNVELLRDGRSFISRGVATRDHNGMTTITELPVGRWTSDYKKWLLDQMAEGKAYWESFTEGHTDRSVCFTLMHGPIQSHIPLQQGDASLDRLLNLEARHSLANVHAFDAQGELRHFSSPHEIIELHADARIAAYSARKTHELRGLKDELDILNARSRFIGMALRDELPLFKRAKKHELINHLHAAGFPPHIGGAHSDAALDETPNGPTVDQGKHIQGDETMSLEADGSNDSRAYDYLLRMPLISLTDERAAKLDSELALKRSQVQDLHHTSEHQMWVRELEALRAPLTALCQAADMQTACTMQHAPCKKQKR